MPFDSNGVFSRVHNWVSDAAAHIPIKSDRHDEEDNNFASGLSLTITKDGRTQPTANLPMNGHKLVNVADPTAPQDVATKNYVDRLQTFTTSINISGADMNGVVNFSSATGANGLSFVGADLSWLARLATAAGPGTPPNPAATLNRLVLNTKPDGSGTDVVTINDDGSVAATSLTTTSVITAAGTVTAGTVLAVKATTGNEHVWWYGPANEDRMVMYTASASMGHGYIRVNGTQTYTFQNDGQFLAPSSLHAGGATFNTDGNVNGSVWQGGWLSTHIENRASAYAANKVGVTQMQRVGLTYSGNVAGAWTSPAGTVLVGYNREAGTSGQLYGAYYMTLQIYDDKNGWRNMGG